MNNTIDDSPAQRSAQSQIDKLAAGLDPDPAPPEPNIYDLRELLNRLLFWSRGPIELQPSREPVCDFCGETITHEQFQSSAVTLNHSTLRWRVTHNDCESDDSIATSCFQYWIALSRLSNPLGAMRMTVHLIGHIGFPSWERDVIDRLYAVAKPGAQAKAS